MTTVGDAVTYLYCLVQADRRPSLAGAPRGLPGASPPRLLAAGEGLWLVTAEAPLALYGSQPIERALRDLDWVAVRGAAHARVVDHFARRHPTLPMRLFTLFASDARAVAHAQGARARLRRLLARVAGRQEWGVRVRLDPTLIRRRPAAPTPAGPAARAGTRFLLAKKQQRDAAQALLRDGRAAVEDAYTTLAGLADAARRRPAAELNGTRLVLDAAMLVPVRRRGIFRRAVGRASARLAGRGYRLTLTGPWPAYHFVSDGR